MAQDKRVFTGGMDKDSDPRLIENGDYRHAENVRNIASSDGTSGSVENIESTQKVPFNFINETVDENIQITDSGHIEPLPPQATKYSQDIFITWHKKTISETWFEIFNVNENNQRVSMGHDYSFIRCTHSAYPDAGPLYRYFNHVDGSLSKNIPIIDRSSGEYKTASSSVNFTENDSVVGRTITITITADEPGIDFILDFSSKYQYAVPGGDSGFWSATLDDYPPYGRLWIEEQGGVTLGSTSSFEGVGEDNNTTTEDGNPVGTVFVSESANTTQWNLTFNGAEPTTPQDPNIEGEKLSLFTWTELVDGGFSVEPFLEFGENLFNTGDEFEFSSTQTSLSTALVNHFTNFESLILSPGVGDPLRTIVSTSAGNFTTGFTSGDKLNGDSISVFNNSANASATDFYLLNSYHSNASLGSYAGYSNSLDIQDNIITLEVENAGDIHASEDAIQHFPVPTKIKSDQAYLITANISTYSFAGNNTFCFEIDSLNQSPYITTTDSDFEWLIPANQLANDKIGFNLKMLQESITPSAGDKLVIENLVISELKAPLSSLEVMISANAQFNLAIDTSVESLKSKLDNGNYINLQSNFVSGVSVNLEAITQAGVTYNHLTDENENLQSNLENLESDITILNSKLTAMQDSYNSNLVKLETAADISAEDSLATLDALQVSQSGLTQHLGRINQSVTDILANLQLGQATAEEVNNLNSQILDLQSQIDDKDAEITNLENQLEEALADVDALPSGVTQADYDAAVLAQTNAESNLADAQNEKADLQAQLDDLNQAIYDAITNVNSDFGVLTDLGTPDGLASVGVLIEAYNALSSSSDGLEDEVQTIINTLSDSFDLISTEDLGTTLEAQLTTLQGIVNNIVTLKDGLDTDSSFTSLQDFWDHLGTLKEVVVDISGQVNTINQTITSYVEGTSELSATDVAALFDVTTSNVQSSYTTLINSIAALKAETEEALNNQNTTTTQEQINLIAEELAAAQAEVASLQAAIAATDNVSLGSSIAGGVVANIDSANDQFYVIPSSVGYSKSAQGTGLVTLGGTQLSKHKWGASGTDMDVSHEVGTGQENTLTIVNHPDHINDGIVGAAEACANYESGDYDDWFLPSSKELENIINNRASFQSDDLILYSDGYDVKYWSSSDYNPTYGHTVAISDTGSVQRQLTNKGISYFVLPVRVGVLSDYNTNSLQTQLVDAQAQVATLQSQYDNAVANLGDDGVTQADVDAVQVLLDDANALNEKLQVDLANAEANIGDGTTQADVDAVQVLLDASKLTVADLQSQLETALANQEDGVTQANVDAAYAEGVASVTPEDGVTQADLDALQILLDEATLSLTNSLEQSSLLGDVIELSNYLGNGNFDDNSSSGWALSSNWSVVDEKIKCDGTSGYTSSYSSASRDTDITTTGNYIFSYKTSGNTTRAAVSVRLTFLDETSNMISSTSSMNNGTITDFVTITDIPSGGNNDGKFRVLVIPGTSGGNRWNGTIDDVSLYKVPDDVVISDHAIQQIQGGGALHLWNFNNVVLEANAYLSQSDLDEAYAEGVAEGAASVIPEDGVTQADVDAAYASGAASVTPEDGVSQADVDAAVAEGYDDGLWAGYAIGIQDGAASVTDAYKDYLFKLKHNIKNQYPESSINWEFVKSNSGYDNLTIDDLKADIETEIKALIHVDGGVGIKDGYTVPNLLLDLQDKQDQINILNSTISSLQTKNLALEINLLSLIGAISELSGFVENFDETSIQGVISDLGLATISNAQYIEEFQETYTSKTGLIEATITQLKEKLQNISNNTTSLETSAETYRFTIFGSWDDLISVGDQNMINGAPVEDFVNLYMRNAEIDGYTENFDHAITIISGGMTTGATISDGVLNSCFHFGHVPFTVIAGSGSYGYSIHNLLTNNVDTNPDDYLDAHLDHLYKDHSHYKVISHEDEEDTILRLTIKNFDKNSGFPGKSIENTIDINGDDISQGLVFEISILSGPKSNKWEFALGKKMWGDPTSGFDYDMLQDNTVQWDLVDVPAGNVIVDSGVSNELLSTNDTLFHSSLTNATDLNWQESNLQYNGLIGFGYTNWVFNASGNYYGSTTAVITSDHALRIDFNFDSSSMYEIRMEVDFDEPGFATPGQPYSLKIDFGEYWSDHPSNVSAFSANGYSADTYANLTIDGGTGYSNGVHGTYNSIDGGDKVIRINTGTSFSAGSAISAGNYDNTGLRVVGGGNGFKGKLKRISIKKVNASEEVSHERSYISVLGEKIRQGRTHEQRNSSPVYGTALSNAYNGSARKIVRHATSGNTYVTTKIAGGYVCVGSYEDKPKNKIYYFVSHEGGSNKYDSILEYDLMNDVITTVYQDDRGSTDASDNCFLNLWEKHLIVGVNKVDDILYWTDNYNRPRKLNVELAKANEKNIEDCKFIFKDTYFRGHNSTVFIGGSENHPFKAGDDIYAQYNTTTHINRGFNGYAEVLAVIPKINDDVYLEVTKDSSTVVASEDHGLTSDNIGDWIGIHNTSTSMAHYYEISNISGLTITLASPYNQDSKAAAYPLNFNSVNVPGIITDCPWANNTASASGIVLYANPEGAYSPLISYGNVEQKSKYFDVVKHQPTHKPDTELNLDTTVATNNILDNVFQFKYRYHHTDEEFTAYGPISDVNIDPSFAANFPLNASNYTATKNKIEIYYEDTISDVKNIEIVGRKGNQGKFFLIDSIPNNFINYLKKLKNDLITKSELDYPINDISSKLGFYNNGTYPFVDAVDSGKLFDAVPKLAKAQTMLSNNRLAYGNVLEGYDNTRMVVNSEFSGKGAPTLQSENVDVLFNGALTSHDGGDTFWIRGSHSKAQYRPEIDLSTLNLDATKAQTLELNFSFEFQYTSSKSSSTLRRAGNFSGRWNITGISSNSELASYIVNRINSGDFEGGCNKVSGFPRYLTNKEQITATVEGNAGIIKITMISATANGNGHTNGIHNAQFRPSHATIAGKFISGTVGLGSFKTGAYHNFGIAYFDETNRCSFVNVSPDYGAVGQEIVNGKETTTQRFSGTRCYNKFYSEPGGPDLGTSSSVVLDIYNRPPEWATNYQVYYTGNTTVDDFIQMTVVDAVPGTSNDEQIYLSLQSLKGENWSYNQANNSQIDYIFAPGDRVRFISYDPGTGRRKYAEYVDLEIAGVELYSEGADDAINENGYFLRINDPKNTTVKVISGDLGATSTVDISHAGLSGGEDGTGYEKLVVEIYRPKKNIDEDFLVYYEVGEKIPIKNGYHSGDANQSGEFTFNDKVGVEISHQPARVQISSGDIYFKPRNMAVTNNGSDSDTFFPEDYYLNDFHRTNHYSIGRINVINNNAAERRLEASVYYSEPYSSTGSINGLSSFNLANSPYFDYNKDFGSIQALKNLDDDLLIFHENKVGRVLVGKDILNTASAEGLVSLSTNVIANYVTLYAGEYGCCLQPESIVKYGNRLYFMDIKRGSILRLSTDGLTPISDAGMKDYFRDIGEMYVIYDPESQPNQIFNIVAGYDAKYDEYVITLPAVYERDSGNWDNESKSFDKLAANTLNLKPKKVFWAKTLAFSESTNRWTSFYSFYPEFYSKIGNQFIGFQNGYLWKHNMTDRSYQDIYEKKGVSMYPVIYNNHYGIQSQSKIEFPFNVEPSSVKTYNAISLESDTKLFTSMQTNIGQTARGPANADGYNSSISTSIGYRRVGGVIINGAYSNNTISGVNTRFYEDTKKGDVVKIWGYYNNTYTSVIRVVREVLSNNLLKLNTHCKVNFDKSYMEVIDYKTREGVQYSQIPFVPGIDRFGSYGLNSSPKGDGSEMIGVGRTDAKKIINHGLYYRITDSNLQKVPVNHAVKVGGSSTSMNLILGASYMYHSHVDAHFNIDEVDPLAYRSMIVDRNQPGDMFVCTSPPSAPSASTVIPLEYMLHAQYIGSGETLVLGYPFVSEDGSISFYPIKDHRSGRQNSRIINELSNGNEGLYLFLTKNGKVEGEKMKGSYMMTELSTSNANIGTELSKYKFNLYSASVDVDKSELSNR